MSLEIGPGLKLVDDTFVFLHNGVEVLNIDASGNVKLKNGTTEHGTAGMIWCSVDADGTGKWQAQAGGGDGVPNEPDTPAIGSDPIKPTKWKNEVSYWDGATDQNKDGDIKYTATSPAGDARYEFNADTNNNPQLKVYDTGLVKAQHLASEVYTHPLSTSITLDINWSNGNLQIIDFNNTNAGVVTINTPTNPEAGACYTLEIIQGVNLNTISWPVIIKWEGGTSLVPTAIDDAIDIVTLVYDGVNYYASYGTNFS